MKGEFIERRIVTGLIVSNDFMRRIARFWEDTFLESPELQKIARWCLDHFDKYEKVPDRDIEMIYMDNLQKGSLSKAEGEIIEEILTRISDDYERGDLFNSGYLFDRATAYFRHRDQIQIRDRYDDLVDAGDVERADELLRSYAPKSFVTTIGLEVGSEEGYKAIEEAFSIVSQPVVKYPGEIGKMMNPHLIRGGFVAFLAPEKRGKCIPGDQLVLTSTGETISIQKLVEDERKDIVSYDEKSGKFVKSQVSQFYRNGPKEVWALTTRTGRRVKTTSNHPFLTPLGWRELQDLSIGQFVAVPKNIPVFGSNLMSDEEVKLLAYFIADGCTGNANGDVMGFTKGEKAIQDDFSQCVSKMGCLAVWKGISCDVVNSKENRYKRNKNHVKQFLRNHGLMQKRSYEKEIPQSVFSLQRSQLSLFLSVLITCDGWVMWDGSHVGFTVANEKLARQVQELLSRFGIVSGLSFAENDKRGAWSVTIGDYENIHRFGNEIGFLFGKKEKFEKAMLSKKVAYRSFLDKFPRVIARSFYAEVEREFGVFGSRRNRWDPMWCIFITKFARANFIREQLQKPVPIMRQSFDEVRNTKAGIKYMDSSILWDEISSIERIGVEETFDLTVDKHHNFVAENVIVHNTWFMMDIALRALRQQANVAFFQAGDLTQAQMLRRMCIYFSRRSDDPAYCKPRYRAVGDCIRNQFDVCKRKDRNCAFGIYDDEMDRFIAEPHEFEKLSNLIEKAQEFDDYRPCDSHGCKDRQATVWVVEEPEKEPLTGKEAVDFARAFFTKWKRRFKLHCAPSGSLSTEDMRRVLDEWENQDDFVPDVIVTDYADIMASPEREYRHKQDGIWRGLRGISQERHSLVITATQADARSYGQSILNLSNFSEDKRKYAHVTAMFGLNQDPKGREKQLGILRVNELLVREGIFNSNNDVVVLQDLGSGRPFTESYAPVRI